jgi:hypothetical protein
VNQWTYGSVCGCDEGMEGNIQEENGGNNMRLKRGNKALARAK